METGKYIGTAIIPRGVKALSRNMEEFFIKRDTKMNIIGNSDGEMSFEHDGDFYFVKAKDTYGFTKSDNAEILPETEEIIKSETLPTVKQKAHPEVVKISPVDFEYVKYMGKSLGKKRSEMPQFDVDTFTDVLLHFSDSVKISKLKKKLKDLKPTQDELNEDKILEMIKNKVDYKSTKYLISLDGYLLDSTHRWAVGLEDSPDFEVDCYRISLPMKSLLIRANKLKIAKKKDINDNEIKKSLSNLTKEQAIELVQNYTKFGEKRQPSGSFKIKKELTNMILIEKAGNEIWIKKGWFNSDGTLNELAKKAIDIRINKK